MHVASIVESVADYVRIHSGIKPFNADGNDGSEWIVLDYGDIWAHIFLPEAYVCDIISRICGLML